MQRAVASFVYQHNSFVVKNIGHVTKVKRAQSWEDKYRRGESPPLGSTVQPWKPSLERSRGRLSEGDAGTERTVGGRVGRRLCEKNDMSTPFWTYMNRTIYLMVYEFIGNNKIAFLALSRVK